MVKVILCSIFFGFSLTTFSQENKSSIDFWQATLGSEKTKLLMEAIAKMDTSFEVNSSPLIDDKGNFQPFMLLDDGNKLLFYIQEKNVPVLSKSVDVYSYTDVKMQDHQIRDASIARRYAAIFDFNNLQLIRLENEGEKLVARYGGDEISDIQLTGKYVLLYDFGSDIFTYDKDGSINEAYSMAEYSWNKGLECDVYLVSLQDGSKRLIKKDAQPASMSFPFFRLSPDGNYVLSFENKSYYAYNIDKGTTNCISKNLSKYFTSENFRDHVYNPNNSIKGWKDSLIVMVKDNHSGVWELDLSGKKTPLKQLNKLMDQNQTININDQSPGDGKIQTEEISWKAFDGKTARGVLAKPKDFDAKKKYPIIFIYYENSIITPNQMSYGMGDFVDYGYLVFSPDINFTMGETGESVFNYVISAAEYLKKRPYVDSKKMGLRGASFGGYETNYLVTHTNLFAAAISFSGYSDFISNIGARDNWIRPHQLEGTDQNRLGATMWQRPDIWVKNSPIFYANKVTTPLLLIHSKSDEDVPFEQSLEFFRALRSLGKTSWLLQYDDAGHMGVTNSIVGKPYGDCDFCTRQLQFFNYYLKGDPAPLWMLDGVPARLKGIETGLQLDSTGRTPGPGLKREKLVLTPQQQELLKHETMVTDDGKIIDTAEKRSNNKN